MDENCSGAGSRWRAAGTGVAPAGAGTARRNLSRNVRRGVQTSKVRIGGEHREVRHTVFMEKKRRFMEYICIYGIDLHL